MAVDRATVARWLDDYVRAWETYDAAAIGRLFSEDVVYRYHPYDEPVVGRVALVEDWLSDTDPPGSFEAHYEPVAVDGSVGVATGTSTYFDDQRTKVVEIFDNCFLLEFDSEARCRDFTEYYIKRPIPS
jgi:hypothetical protein